MTNRDRFVLQRTAELLDSAVRQIDMLVTWLGGDEDAGFGGLATKGAVKELYRLGAEITAVLSDASVFITDQWPYIENNKARLFEMGRLSERQSVNNGEYRTSTIYSALKCLLKDSFVIYTDRFELEDPFFKQWILVNNA